MKQGVIQMINKNETDFIKAFKSISDAFPKFSQPRSTLTTTEKLQMLVEENRQLKKDLDCLMIAKAEQEHKLKNTECELRFYKDYYRRMQGVKHG